MAIPTDWMDRGHARPASGRTPVADTTLRYTAEPGVADTGTTTLDRLWWIGTAAQIFSRMPRAPGGGEGSAPQQNEQLADKLIATFGPVSGNFRQLGKMFGLDSGTKDDLRERVAANLAEIARPAVDAWLQPRAAPSIAEQSVEDEIPMGAPAVAPPPQALKKRPAGFYLTESRCIHHQRFKPHGLPRR